MAASPRKGPMAVVAMVLRRVLRNGVGSERRGLEDGALNGFRTSYRSNFLGQRSDSEIMRVVG